MSKYFLWNRFLLVVLTFWVCLVAQASSENPRRRRFYKDAQFSHIQNYSLSNVIIASEIVKNQIDCVHACLDHKDCVSVNYKTQGTPDHICELCNQTFYSTKDENKIIKPGYVHFWPPFPSVCLESPCQNGGTCLYVHDGVVGGHIVVGYQCSCHAYTSGRHCEIGPFESCKDIITKTRNNDLEDGMYTVVMNSTVVEVKCHMKNITGCQNNGWMLVMKTDPHKETFAFHSSYWSNKIAYNVSAGKTGFDSYETKLPTYWMFPFTEICVGFKVGKNINFITIPYNATSLYDVIADGFQRKVTVGRHAWKSLIPRASLQPDCDLEGFNLLAPWGSRLRLGIIADYIDNSTPCVSKPDSYLGFAKNRFPGSFHHGNVCSYSSSQCDTKTLEFIPAFGYILVR